MKKIEINSKEKLFKKIKYYKTILYSRVEFVSQIDDSEIDSNLEGLEIQGIIKALNIKNKWKRVEFMYDYLCELLDNYYDGKNICEFCDNKCLAQQFKGSTYENGCCRLCKYQSPTGCTSSNLTCKLYYCEKVKSKNNTIEYKDLKMMKLFSLRQRLIIKNCFFSSREEMLLDLKVGSIVFYAIRILYRVLRNLIYVKTKIK